MSRSNTQEEAMDVGEVNQLEIGNPTKRDAAEKGQVSGTGECSGLGEEELGNGITSEKDEASDVQTNGLPPLKAPAVIERTARLLITKLEMENFKSYGGLREIGPFHKCFSSIVGPNGSGKSNVIDAMLFVFGKRAKKLRLNKVSELIHRSDTFPNLDYARVSVHFVDILDVEGSEDDYEEVPGTELVVTRTAYINNQSKYQVDGKNATFTEVGALLRKRGVDLDNNRFLILQGEVEQIAMMKPKALTPHEEGLLEYLEDIIGSDRFVEAAEDAMKTVDTLNEQRNEKLNRLKLAEKERDSLEGARNEAEEFLRLDAAIREKLNVLYQTMVAHAAANVENVEIQEKEKKERLEYERGKLTNTLKEIEEMKKVHDKTSKEYEGLKVEMAKVKEEFHEYERLDIKYQESVKFFKEQIRKLETAIKKDDKKANESLARAEELEGSLERLKEGVAQAEARKASEDAALEEVNESLKGKTAELREELEGEQEKARPVREKYDALKNKVDTCKYEIKLVRESTENAKKRLSDAEKTLSQLLKKAETDKVELANAKKEAQTMQLQIAQAEEKCDQNGQNVAAATQAMTKAVAAAEEAKAARESAAGKSAALRSLLEASVEGGALHGAGICGRLGDLGIIEAEYDAAVSSCSSTLDHVVVETAEGATACVEFLRQNNLGRASFVILEKLGHLESAMSQRFRAPPGCPRLFDLVKVSKPRFRPAFYLALRDTLVAPDLDIAVATAYEKGTNRSLHRVVTSNGDLIDRSGAMTGGGNSVKRGAMRTTGSKGGGGKEREAIGGSGIVSAAQAEKLVREAREAEDDVRAARLAKKNAEGELKKLHSRSKELQTVIPKLEMRIEGVGASEEQCREQIESLQAQCRLTPEAEAKLEGLNSALAADEAALAKVFKSLEKAEAAVQALQKAILGVGGEKLKKAVKRADAASKALDEAVEAFNRAEVEGKGERKKGEKSAKDAARRRAELEELKEKKEQAKDDFKGMEEKASDVLEAFEKAEAEVKAKGVELQEIVDGYDKAKALADKIRGVEVDISHQLGEYDKVIKDNTHKVKHWTGELKKLKKLHQKEAEDWSLDNQNEEADDDVTAEEGKQACTDDEEDMDDDDEAKDGKDGASRAKSQEEGTGRSASAANRKRSGASGILPELSAEELEDIDRESLKLEIGEMESQKKAKESGVNLPALALYRKREEEYHSRVKDLEEATLARNEARGRHEELRRQRLEEFMAGFGQITLRLKEMYQMITLGGDAELELVDSLDPFSEGIVFSVRPPKKSWKNIANLSGGEKTLSSLALVFALHHFKPTPLYVMDEIDAALDFKNVSIVANYIKERTKNAQFIIISLRNNMFELADRLVGIYKTHNVTKSVTINPKEFSQQQQKAKAAGVLGDTTNSVRPVPT